MSEKPIPPNKDKPKKTILDYLKIIVPLTAGTITIISSAYYIYNEFKGQKWLEGKVEFLRFDGDINYIVTIPVLFQLLMIIYFLLQRYDKGIPNLYKINKGDGKLLELYKYIYENTNFYSDKFNIKILKDKQEKIFKNNSERAIINIRFVIKIWLIICLIWLAFYGLKFISFYEENIAALLISDRSFSITDIKKYPNVKDFVFNVINNSETVFFGILYFVFAYPFYLINKNMKKVIQIFVTFLIIFTTLDFLLKFFICDSIDIHYILTDIIFGFLSSIFIAMLVGKFNSKFIPISQYKIAILFAYAGTQPFYPFFRYFKYLIDENIITNHQFSILCIDSLIITIALIGKIILFKILYSSIRNYDFFLYFLKILQIKPSTKTSKKIILLLDDISK